MSACYDYGRAGIIGIGTPQANPTVEAEMRILLPQNALLQTTRLASSAPESLDRLREYQEPARRAGAIRHAASDGFRLRLHRVVLPDASGLSEIGRAPCRDRVCQ